MRRPPCAFVWAMLRRFRLAPPVRTALCLAAALSVTGSLGLHAELGPAQGLRAVIAPLATAPAKGGTTTHPCLLCVLYGSVFPSFASPVVTGFAPALSGPVTRQAARAEGIVAPNHDGRAPPALL